MNVKCTLPIALARALAIGAAGGQGQAGGRAVGADVSWQDGATCILVEVVGPQGARPSR